MEGAGQGSKTIRRRGHARQGARRTDPAARKPDGALAGWSSGVDG
ncbi:hypothetical protein [Streptosporangium amethystogenes]|nr:hypothetical protein [Streptosporangium amethystogenes]